MTTTTDINPWFQDKEEHDDHLNMIKNPSTWPSSLLHLKHPARMEEKGSQETAFGMISANDFNIYVGHGARRTIEHHDSAESIMKAGWVVD